MNSTESAQFINPKKILASDLADQWSWRYPDSKTNGDIKVEVSSPLRLQANTNGLATSIIASNDGISGTAKVTETDSGKNEEEPLILNNFHPGKQGILYLEYQLPEQASFRNSDVTGKKLAFVSVYNKKLLYSKPLSADMSESEFMSSSTGTACMGYIDISPRTEIFECKQGNAKVFSFVLKENQGISIILSTSSDNLRKEWIDVLKKAINAVSQSLPLPALVIPEYNKLQLHVQMQQSLDFPCVKGYLNKISSGNSTLGFKVVKKRWFQLEGGELRYYEDEDVKPSKLKNIIDLNGATVINDLGDSRHKPTSVFIQLKSGRLMQLEATTSVSAQEWINSIRGTIALLESLSDRCCDWTPSRRYNLHERVAPATYETECNNSPLKLKSLVESPKVSFKSPELLGFLASALRQHFLLKSLPDISLLLERLDEKTAFPSEVLFWQGSSGDFFYILESGSCDVIKDGNVVSSLGAGKVFGEMALLNSTIRQATIRATEYCRIWCLHRKDFREVAYNLETTEIQSKVKFLKQIDLFEKFIDSSLEKVADVMIQRVFKEGEKIIKQGDTGDCFYIILSGRVLVTQQSFGGSVVELVRLGPKKYFGELALIDNSPRKATVTATTIVTCWVIDRISFLKLFGNLNEAINTNVGMSALKKVKLLESLSDRQLLEIAKALTKKEFLESEIIIKQGDTGDSFYLVAEGEVAVYVNHVQVAVLGAGSFFGEMSLLSNEKRNATVTASTKVACLILTRIDFNRLLGPLDELIKAESRYRQAQQEMLNKKTSTTEAFSSKLRSLRSSFFSSSTRNSITSTMRRDSLAALYNNSFDLDQLEKVRRIGVGTFGRVDLVKHSVSQKYYALKSMTKQHLYLCCQESLTLLERDVMMKLSESPYVPQLYATLQNDFQLYFVQQFVPGGDLFSLIHSNKIPRTKLGGISLPFALFYAANALAAVSFMHSKDVIHRDLKPENMVIDASGYLKIVDYGCAKIISITGKTKTLCGAPQYIAPEMVLSKGYNRSVDFWALGVLIFELLTRETPFNHSNLVILYQNIIQPEDSFSTRLMDFPTFDTSARSLLASIFVLNQNTRLGSLNNGIQDILNHNFFKGMDTEKLDRRAIPPPIIPDSTTHENTRLEDLEIPDIFNDLDEEIVEYKGSFDYTLF